MPLYICSKHKMNPKFGCDECIMARQRTSISKRQHTLLKCGWWSCGCEEFDGKNKREAHQLHCYRCGKSRPAVRIMEINDAPPPKAKVKKQEDGDVAWEQLDIFSKS